MRRPAVFALAIAVLISACFPHDQTKRRIAYGVEAGVMVGGIAVLALANPAADCDRQDDSCRSKADILSGIGVGLLLAGIAGLVATVATAESAEQPPPKKILTDDTPAKPEETPAPAAEPAPADPATPPTPPTPPPPAPTEPPADQPPPPPGT